MPRKRSKSLEGIHIRIAGLVHGMTFAELGALTECNAETARRYVNGSSVPSVDFVARLAEAAGVSASWLITGKGPRDEELLRQHAIQSLSLKDMFLIIADRVGRLEEAQARWDAEKNSSPAAAGPIITLPREESVAASTGSGLRLADGAGRQTTIRQRGPRGKGKSAATPGPPARREAVPRAQANSTAATGFPSGQPDPRSHRVGA